LDQSHQRKQNHASYVLPLHPDSTAAFSLGFVLGQTTAYIEQVVAGAKLAAEIGCSKDYLEEILVTVSHHNCEALVRDREYGRVGVWIFRLPYVRKLIEEMTDKTTPPTAAEVWAMGKLFGYSDAEIGTYLQRYDLVRSASDSESNQRPCGSKSD
jgi:hypothetical protein